MVPKYRCRILGRRVARRVGVLLEHIAREHGWRFAATDVMLDHVHLFAKVGPTSVPAQVVGAVGGEQDPSSWAEAKPNSSPAIAVERRDQGEPPFGAA